MRRFLLFLIIAALLCGCNGKEKAPTWESYTNLRMKVKKGIFIQDENLKKPGALFAAEDFLYILTKKRTVYFVIITTENW